MRIFLKTLSLVLENLEKNIRFIDQALNSKKIAQSSQYEKLKRLAAENGIEDARQWAEYLKQFDPSEDSKYVFWIFKSFILDNISLPEDGGRFFNALSKFSKAIKLPSFDGEKDINKVKGLRSLEDLVKDISKEESAPLTLRSWESYVKKQKSTLLKLIFEDELYSIYQLPATPPDIPSICSERGGEYGTFLPVSILSQSEVNELREKAKSKRNFRKGQEANLSLSAYILADIARKGTQWCVADVSTAESYLARAPMYIGLRQGRVIFLSDRYFEEFMSVSDLPLHYLTPRLALFFAKVLESQQSSPGRLPDDAIHGIRECIRKALLKIKKHPDLNEDVREKLTRQLSKYAK